MVTKQNVITLDEFETYIHGDASRERLELIHGTIVEKPMPTQLHGIVAGNFFLHIKLHLHQHPIGYVSIETAHRAAGDDYNRRLPDVSYVAEESDAVTTQGAVPKMPDIAIEVISPDQTVRELREKAHYYLSNGTRMVLIALTDTKQIEVHTPGKIIILEEDNILDLGDILPDFRVKVAEFFRLR